MKPLLILLLLAGAPPLTAASAPVHALDAAAAARFAQLALDCVHREYPNKIAHVLSGDEDARPPRELTPVFYGCYDWHSSVHGHWLLVRLMRLFPDAEFAPAARAALARSFTEAGVLAEVAYLRGAGRVSFERPYGLAWLLQLAAELRDWDDRDAQQWSQWVVPLESEAAARISDWLPKLRYPIRIGEHAQTAFALGLVRDWAVIAGDDAMRGLVDKRARFYHATDVDCPMAYEPGGQDFLSPCLAEADLMRRLMLPGEFAAWLGRFLPGIPRDGDPRWLEPAIVTDRADPKLAHIDGLNLSRAWMLRGIAHGLPLRDRRRLALLASADRHAAAALPAVTGEHYEGGHWLGSFAVYLLGGSGR